jgi:L-ascorbate metabolism protein UlaG (beta-lactamase superfamily)
MIVVIVGREDRVNLANGEWIEHERIGWGVPKARCIVMKPGDVVKIKDIEIHALDAFDRTDISTQVFGPINGTSAGQFCMTAAATLTSI